MSNNPAKLPVAKNPEQARNNILHLPWRHFPLERRMESVTQFTFKEGRDYIAKLPLAFKETTQIRLKGLQNSPLYVFSMNEMVIEVAELCKFDLNIVNRKEAAADSLDHFPRANLSLVIPLSDRVHSKSEIEIRRHGAALAKIRSIKWIRNATANSDNLISSFITSPEHAHCFIQMLGETAPQLALGMQVLSINAADVVMLKMDSAKAIRYFGQENLDIKSPTPSKADPERAAVANHLLSLKKYDAPKNWADFDKRDLMAEFKRFSGGIPRPSSGGMDIA